jgi:hypothetical protein
MKKNLKDYRKEMVRMQAGSDALHKRMPVAADQRGFQRREGYPKVPPSKKWITALLPFLVALLMAILALISIIYSAGLIKG